MADLNVDDAERLAKQIVADGGTAIYVPMDVSDEESAKEMARRAIAEFGSIDYLVNNAAICGDRSSTFCLRCRWLITKSSWVSNHDGVLLCTRAVYTEMAKRGGGAIVDQSSSAAWLYSNSYGVARVGGNGLTQQLSRELGERRSESTRLRRGRSTPKPPERSHPAKLVKKIPLSRMGPPDDLVGM